MPTGGPKDKEPPELVLSVPLNNEKNFQGRSLELTFNEDIKLKDPKEEILIIPSVGNKTRFTVKKKKLIIEPEQAWLPNTTYSINFRDGVQDLTEGNPADNLRLAFSTGSTIDSLYIHGNVKETFSEKIPSKITIALYESDTFDIFKHTPLYFTKSDKEGNYQIPNLKSATYYIYAFDDKNKNLKVDSKTELFGFKANSIPLENSKDSVELVLIKIDSRPLLLTNIRHTDKNTRVRFNKPFDSLKIIGISSKDAIYTYGTDQSEIIFYNFFQQEDSLKVQLIATDSISQQLDTTIFIKYGEIKTISETLKTKEIENKYSYFNKKLSYSFTLNKPIGRINQDSLYIRYDSITTTPVQLKDIHIDTLRNQVTIYAVIEPLKENQNNNQKVKDPELVLGKGAFITIEQDSTKRLTKKIKIPTEEDLGLISIKVETKIKNYIVQLTDNNNKLSHSITNIKDYTFKYLEPMEYRLRIIVDENQNGIWDPGNFHQKLEPETIILYKSEEGKYSFPLRANWEYGPLLIKF
jgi:hypothetical protein